MSLGVCTLHIEVVLHFRAIGSKQQNSFRSLLKPCTITSRLFFCVLQTDYVSHWEKTSVKRPTRSSTASKTTVFPHPCCSFLCFCSIFWSCCIGLLDAESQKYIEALCWNAIDEQRDIILSSCTTSLLAYSQWESSQSVIFWHTFDPLGFQLACDLDIYRILQPFWSTWPIYRQNHLMAFVLWQQKLAELNFRCENVGRTQKVSRKRECLFQTRILEASFWCHGCFHSISSQIFLCWCNRCFSVCREISFQTYRHKVQKSERVMPALHEKSTWSKQ